MGSKLLAAGLICVLWSGPFSCCRASADEKSVQVPDLTRGDRIPQQARHDWNLGPTGLRGWMFCDRMVTTDARQIAVTEVGKGSPAEGVFRVGDVLLDEPRREHVAGSTEKSRTSRYDWKTRH